jgi:hypothetical protein
VGQKRRVSESAEQAPSVACASCGTPIPAPAHYCPGCGSPVDDETGTTVRLEVPPDETGPVPVSHARAEPRWFGVAPSLLLLVLTVVAVVAAVAFFVVGHWALGLIAGGVAVLLATVFLEVARRKPDAEVSRRSLEAVDDARARAGSVIEALAIRGRASRQAALLRLELRRLYARRRELLAAFGDAVYRGASSDGLRGEIEALDERAQTLDAELHALAVSTRERVENARLAVQQTQMLSVPEPYPPPDEGDPAQPAIVPEPAPPPDEGTPPPPDPVPTPSQPDDE